MHTHAAALLTAAGADPEAIAAHLLLTERREDPEQTTVLVAAADQAIARAAPDSAVAYLRRALDAAPPHKPPPWLLFELGRCEQMVRDSAAIGHLRAALEAETDRRARARIALVLAGSLFYVADLAGSHAVLTSALENLTDADKDLAIQLMAVWAQAGYGDPRLHPQVVQALPRIREMAGSTGSGAPDLLTFLALVAVTQGEPSHAVLELVERGLGGRQLLDSASSDSTSVALSVDILVYIDELDRAREVSAAMLEDARRRGRRAGRTRPRPAAPAAVHDPVHTHLSRPDAARARSRSRSARADRPVSAATRLQ
jgi:hypothetical protein